MGVVLAVVAGLWLLTRDGPGQRGTAIGEAVSVPTSPTTATAASASSEELEPSDATPLSSATATSTSPTSTAAAGGGPTIDPSRLAASLLSEADLPGATTLRDGQVTSNQDPEHPLTDYRFCNVALDLSRAGPAAKRVVTTNFLSPDALVASTLTLTESSEAARALIDQMVANASGCATYTDNSGLLPAEVRILSARSTPAGALINEQITSGGSSVDLLIVVNQVTDLVSTLEVTPVHDAVELEDIVVSRAAALPH